MWCGLQVLPLLPTRWQRVDLAGDLNPHPVSDLEGRSYDACFSTLARVSRMCEPEPYVKRGGFHSSADLQFGKWGGVLPLDDPSMVQGRRVERLFPPVERAAGIGPACLGWEPSALPLSYARVWSQRRGFEPGTSSAELMRFSN